PQNTDGDATFKVKEPEFKVEKPESKVHVSLSSRTKKKKHDDKTKREAKGKNITYSDDEEDVGAEADFTNLETTITVSPIPTTKVHKDHPVTQIIVDLSSATQTRSMTRMVKDQGGLTQINNEDFHTCMFACFLSQEEPKRVHQALKNPSWIEAMQEELLQFKMQKVWVLFDLPNRKRAIGLQVKQMPDGIFISQNKYVAKILRKFGLHDEKSASTPIDTEKPLIKDPGGEDVDVHTYRSMIGSLMYLNSSRPDIMFLVCACARFQVTPKALHLHAVKRIFRYLNGKPHLGLWYPTNLPFNLVAYPNSDYAGASMDRKSTTGGCQFLGCRLISWQCKKQTVVATSSTEAYQDKYVAEILRKFGFTYVKSASTPIETEKPLLKDPDGEDVDVHIYRSMIRSLMYLASYRPDIMFAVCARAKFQVTPKLSHLHAVKRIFRYLKGKPYLGLWYPRDSPFNLVAYFDSDYAGACLDRKSTTGGCQFLGCRLISWQCKKQTVVATSLTKAGYVTVASCCA
nr:hypothetical protein [Tanacetum cinerariifolium]